MMNISFRGLAMAALCAAALAGCHTLPTYTFKTGDQVAQAKFMGWGQPSMCKDGQAYTLDTHREGAYLIASIPAGERITLREYLVFSGYHVISHCMVGQSVVPYRGDTLIVNGALSGSMCTLEIVNEDPASEVGVALNYTVNTPTCGVAGR